MGPPPAAVLFMGGGTCGPRGRQRRRWESWTNRRADYRCGKTGTRSARLSTGVKCSDAPPHTTTSCSQASRIALSRSNGEDEDGWTASAHLPQPPSGVARHAEPSSSLSVSTDLTCHTLLFSRYAVPE